MYNVYGIPLAVVWYIIVMVVIGLVFYVIDSRRK